MTGEVWGLLGDRDGNRLLCKINHLTGKATLIGNTNGGGRRFAALAFNADGSILYGGTGNNGSNQQSLFSLDQSNASATLLCAFSFNSSGIALAFNSGDMKLYRGSGSTIFQTVDNTGTCATTGIGVMGSVYEFNNMTYHAGDDLFYVASFDQFSTVTAAGTITNLSSLQQFIKGMTPVANPTIPPKCLPRAIAYFTTEHTFDNESYLWGSYADGGCRQIGPIGFESIRAMDFGPDQRLYAIGERKVTGVQVLIRIDLCTGAGTEVGPATIGNATATDMSFRPTDNLLFVYNSNNRLYRVNYATGASTTVGNTGQSGSGNGIACSDAGTLFHADDANLNTLNTGNGSATLVDGLDFPGGGFNSRIEAMDFQPGTGDLYAVMSESDSVHLVTIDTTNGAVSALQQVISEARTIALTPPPGGCPPVSIMYEYYEVNSGDWDFEDSCDNCDSGPQMLPFPVHIGGEVYTQFVQDVNGYVELYRDGETNYAFGYGAVADLTSDGDPDHTYLLAAYDDLDSSSSGQFGYYVESSRITFFWKVETHADQGVGNVNEFQILLYSDGHVQWNFKTDEVASFDYDMFSGIYLGYARQQLFQIAAGDIPEMTSWRFGDCPIGSCCVPNGSCAVTIEENCTGVWTEGAVCNPNPCPLPMGACCLNDGSCAETTQAGCAGTWTLGGTCSPNPCPPIGSCCLPNGTCFVVKEANCAGTWTEGGTCEPNPCPQPQEGATGACCFSDDSCQVLTAAECDSQIGFYNGDGTTCDDTNCAAVNQQICGALMCGPGMASFAPTLLGILCIRLWMRSPRRGRRP